MDPICFPTKCSPDKINHQVIIFSPFSPSMKEILNLDYLNAHRFQEKMAKRNLMVRIIGNGDNHTDLNHSFTYSLLGERLEWPEFNQELLTPYERSLSGGEYKINTIIDYDGNLGSPIHTLLRYLSHQEYWSDPVGNLKQFGQVPLSQWRWFFNTITSSDQVTLWTSRINPEIVTSFPWSCLVSHLYPAFKAPVDYFPFLGSLAQEKLIRRHPPLKIYTGKSAKDRGYQLAEMIGTAAANISYYYATSAFDRNAVDICSSTWESRGEAEKNRQLVVIDGNHVIF
jgi:hypothetical protein